MKRILVVALSALIVFASCSREHGTHENFHVNFTEDGVSKGYTIQVVAHRDTVNGYYSLEIIGANSPTSINEYMGIYIDNFPGHGNFVAGEYPDNSTSHTVLVTYNKGGTEYTAGQSVAEDAVSYGVTIAHHFKVTITSIDNNTIRGVFSGDYYKDGNVQGTSKLNITNGDFYAKFQ